MKLSITEITFIFLCLFYSGLTKSTYDDTFDALEKHKSELIQSLKENINNSTNLLETIHRDNRLTPIEEILEKASEKNVRTSQQAIDLIEHDNIHVIKTLKNVDLVGESFEKFYNSMKNTSQEMITINKQISVLAQLIELSEIQKGKVIDPKQVANNIFAKLEPHLMIDLILQGSAEPLSCLAHRLELYLQKYAPANFLIDQVIGEVNNQTLTVDMADKINSAVENMTANLSCDIEEFATKIARVFEHFKMSDQFIPRSIHGNCPVDKH